MQFGRCLICFGAAFMSATTLAQTYPTKPVRYVIPMSPGSGADVIGRIVAIGLAPALGQQVVVDNRTGAAGNIGAELVAKAPPDGYTVFQGSMTHTTNVSLYTNLTYDLVRDFAPVTLLATSPASLVVHPSLPVNTVADLVAFAKARPGQLNYASTGLGTATSLRLKCSRSAPASTSCTCRIAAEASRSPLSSRAKLRFISARCRR